MDLEFALRPNNFFILRIKTRPKKGRVNTIFVSFTRFYILFIFNRQTERVGKRIAAAAMQPRNDKVNDTNSDLSRSFKFRTKGSLV